MNFTELAKKRCSVRAYADKPIAPEHLQAVLEAGRLAPTGKNHQPQRILVVQSPEVWRRWRRRCTTPTPIQQRQSS